MKAFQAGPTFNDTLYNTIQSTKYTLGLTANGSPIDYARNQ
jgi:hypothetical protein